MPEDDPGTKASNIGCALLPFGFMSIIPYAPSIVATAGATVNLNNGRETPIFSKGELITLFSLDTLRTLAATVALANSIYHLELMNSADGRDLFVAIGIIGLIESVRVVSRSINYEELGQE